MIKETKHHAMNKQLSQTRPVNVGFLLLSDFSLVAFTGALDVLVTANLVAGKPVFLHTTFGINSTTVTSDLGLNIATDDQIDALAKVKPGSFDVLIVCGGFRSSLSPNPNLIRILRDADKASIMLGGIWNGAATLAQAGLLDGQECAIHPDNHAFMRETCPRVTVSSKTLVHQNNRITCAGPSSAFEMMFSLLKKLSGDELVRAVREILSCDQVAESRNAVPLQLGDDPTLPERLRTLMALMRKNIEEPLTLVELAEVGEISRRQMERLFQVHLGISPSRYYLDLRLSHAQRLLQQTNESITNVALASGFVNISHFSSCYKDTFGMSPSATRAKKSAQ